MELGDICTREAHEKGAEINITHPVTGEKTDFFITVLGQDSRAWRTAIKTGYSNLLASKAGEQEEFDIEVDSLAGITVNWRGLESDGEPVEFSLDTCKKLYIDSPTTRDQVNRFVGNSRNFIKG